MESTKKIIRLSVILALAGSSVMAQTTEDARKNIDAELYQKAIGSLKQLTAAEPKEGENFFLLGRAYLKNDYPDSAKAAFQRGTAADPKYSLNYVGLGAVELNANNAAGAKSNFDLALSKADGRKDNQPNLYIGKAYSEAAVPDFKAALPYLEAAIAINPKDAQNYLAIGTVHRGLDDNSAAYSDYSKAIELDKNLTRAKLELAVSVKMAKAFKEASEKFNELIATDPGYAPVYRELAETYYQWFNNTSDPKLADEKIKLALQAYEKYMEYTDRSVEKRLRHADYLLLAKDYKGLEAEANEMAKMDKSNLRTLRYLGYSAYENGNYPSTIQSLKDFLAKVEPRRIISQDYVYLAKAQVKLDQIPEAIANFKIALAMDTAEVDKPKAVATAEALSDIGLNLYRAKKFDLAATAFDLAVPYSKSPLGDNFYLGLANYFDYRAKLTANESPSKDILVRADSALSKVNQLTPESNEKAYIYRARISRLMDDSLALKGAMMPFFEKYVEVVEKKGGITASSTAGDKADLTEAYNNLGAFYAPTDPAKAKQLWEKTLAYDPTNEYATRSLAALGAANAPPQTPEK